MHAFFTCIHKIFDLMVNFALGLSSMIKQLDNNIISIKLPLSKSSEIKIKFSEKHIIMSNLCNINNW